MTRKNKVQKPLTPIELRREVVEKQAQHIRAEINALLHESEIIEESLSIIEEEFKEVENEYDEMSSKLADKTEEAENLRDQVDKYPLTVFKSIGEIAYNASNLLDRQIIEELRRCLYANRHQELLHILENTSKSFGTSNLIIEA